MNLDILWKVLYCLEKARNSFEGFNLSNNLEDLIKRKKNIPF